MLPRLRSPNGRRVVLAYNTNKLSPRLQQIGYCAFSIATARIVLFNSFLCLVVTKAANKMQALFRKIPATSLLVRHSALVTAPPHVLGGRVVRSIGSGLLPCSLVSPPPSAATPPGPPLVGFIKGPWLQPTTVEEEKQKRERELSIDEFLSPPFPLNSRQEKWDIFERWMIVFNKVYESEEEKMRRFGMFSKNLVYLNECWVAEQKSRSKGIYASCSEFGLNVLSDVTAEEFDLDYEGGRSTSADYHEELRHQLKDLVNCRAETVDDSYYEKLFANVYLPSPHELVGRR